MWAEFDPAIFVSLTIGRFTQHNKEAKKLSARQHYEQNKDAKN